MHILKGKIIIALIFLKSHLENVKGLYNGVIIVNLKILKVKLEVVGHILTKSI